MRQEPFLPPRPARATDFIIPIPIEGDTRLQELRHIVGSIRQNLDAAGITAFCDVPELARAAVLCRVAENVAQREGRS